MLELAQGLNDAALEAIADLERRVVAADGGRLKLEWGTLRTRPADAVRDVLFWEEGRLVGFLGIYGFNWPWLEVTGMVDPDARRRGIARALFDAALPICRAAGKDRLLLVVPRVSPGGRPFAASLGMNPHHSEHALRLRTRPASAADPALALRTATTDDIPALSRLYQDGFGDGGEVDPSRLMSERSRTLIIERDGETAGTVAVTAEGPRAAVYGFVVDADLRGRGIGRDILARVCRDALDHGAEYVDLEVEVANDHALGLYTSTGFEPVSTEDYYELKLPG